MGKMMQCVTRIVAVLRQKRLKLCFRTEGKHAVHTVQATSLHRHQHRICYRYSNSVAPQNNVLFKVNNTKKENQSGEETSPLLFF
jgi:hypothetical protein